MYVRENQLEKNRIGISVSKKVGNSVVRHRLCRLVRESYRLHEKEFHSGYDLVIVARVNAKERTFREIESAFLHLGKLHHILLAACGSGPQSMEKEIRMKKFINQRNQNCIRSIYLL